MPNPPSNGESELPAHTRPASSRAYQTRSTAAAMQPTAGNDQGKQIKESKPSDQAHAASQAPSKPSSDQVNIDSPSLSPLQRMARAISETITKCRITGQAKTQLEGIVKYAREAEEREKKMKAAREPPPVASAIHKAIKDDISHMYTNLAKQLNDIQNTVNETLSGTDKIQKEVETVKNTSKELESKVVKITDTADKIAVATTPYRDAVLSKPAQTNRAFTDPKVLGDIDRKAKQVLVEIFDTDLDNMMAKSLTELKDRANEAIAAMGDGDKPKDLKVVSAYKTCTKAVVLTLNSKEAVTWLRDPTNEYTSTKGFSIGSQFRARQYNIIAPRVPITFNPDSSEHLREVEESNGLEDKTILKAKWIKPVERRKADQTHAYAILTILSAESANLLIRDGLNICNTRICPTKQKLEPVQCMKCRAWGHFASNCLSEKDTCGTCGGDHHTKSCKITSKVFCATCKDSSHPSWDRNCPEFIRRSAIFDEKNPENGMVFFPTEQDWTLTMRPQRIPLEERFPQHYAVNSLQTQGHPSKRPFGEQRNARKHAKGKQRENPNFIPLGSTVEGELPVNGELDRGFDMEYADYCDYNTDEIDPHLITGW